MNDDYEVDYNEESDSEKKVLTKKKLGTIDVEYNKIKNNSLNNINNHRENISKYKKNSNSWKNTNSNLRYYIVFYNSNNSTLIKDYIFQGVLKIKKNNGNELFKNDLLNCKNAYIMFVNNDRQIIKAITKKYFVKFEDREKRSCVYIEMDIKAEQEISFKELVNDYDISNEIFDFLRFNKETSCHTTGHTSSNEFLDIGMDIILKEIKDENLMHIFKKIRNSMMKKETSVKQRSRKRRNSYRSYSSKSSSSSSSSSKGKKINVNPNEIKANNNYLMNYYYPPPQPNTSSVINPLETVQESIQYYPYPYGFYPQIKSDMIGMPGYFPPINPQLLMSIPQIQYYQHQQFSIPRSPMSADVVKSRNPESKDIKNKKKISSDSSSSSKSSNSRLKKKRKASASLSSEAHASASKSRRKKYFNLQQLNNYKQLEMTNSRKKEAELNLNDINIYDQEYKMINKVNISCSSSMKSRSQSESNNYGVDYDNIHDHFDKKDDIFNQNFPQKSPSSEPHKSKESKEINQNKLLNKGKISNRNSKSPSRSSKSSNNLICDVKRRKNFKTNCHYDLDNNNKSSSKKNSDSKRLLTLSIKNKSPRITKEEIYIKESPLIKPGDSSKKDSSYSKYEMYYGERRNYNKMSISGDIINDQQIENNLPQDKLLFTTKTQISHGQYSLHKNKKVISKFSDTPPINASTDKIKSTLSNDVENNTRILIPPESFIFPDKFIQTVDEDKIVSNFINENQTKNVIQNNDDSINASKEKINPIKSPECKQIDLNSKSIEENLNENLKIINVSGKKKIILNKDRKNPDIKIIKRDK